MGEFELIRRYFQRPSLRAVLGNGDDCALIRPAAGHDLAVSTDMLVQDVHFFANVDPARLGWKALAVNLSDLAAMGARPLCFTLALALPRVDEHWLAEFSRGLFDCARRFDCELVGGDTTQGPPTISITVMGEVPFDAALPRSHAKIDDDIWVSGNLGDAALGLRVLKGQCALAIEARAAVVDALELPQPRIALGQALRGLAHAAIDLSDGLAGDLSHILDASGVGASIRLQDIPVSDVLASQDEATRWACVLAGGDDYELCFCAHPSVRTEITNLAAQLQLRLTWIGSVQAQPGLRWTDRDGRVSVSFGQSPQGFDHFAPNHAS